MKFRILFAVMIATVAGQAIGADETLKTDKQQFSYALGINIATGLKRDGLDVDADAVTQGFKDVISGAAPKMTIEEMQAAITAFQEKEMARRGSLGKKNLEEGEKFLADNKKVKGVKELPSGLQYKIIKAGTGKTPKATDTVEVNYRGTLIDGTEFDSSYSRGQSVSFPVNGVIKGWVEALQLMKEGGKWQLFVPSELAYGERGAGTNIAPNATLIFDVELIAIK